MDAYRRKIDGPWRKRPAAIIPPRALADSYIAATGHPGSGRYRVATVEPNAGGDGFRYYVDFTDEDMRQMIQIWSHSASFRDLMREMLARREKQPKADAPDPIAKLVEAAQDVVFEAKLAAPEDYYVEVTRGAIANLVAALDAARGAQ